MRQNEGNVTTWAEMDKLITLVLPSSLMKEGAKMKGTWKEPLRQALHPKWELRMMEVAVHRMKIHLGLVQDSIQAKAILGEVSVLARSYVQTMKTNSYGSLSQMRFYLL